ncbi:MAG: MBG domain-containing protein [Bacteroidota bacterium]
MFSVFASAQLTAVEEQVISGPASQNIGSSIAIEGNIAVVGGEDNQNNRNSSVYVYELANDVWTQIAILSPSSSNDRGFGYSVAIQDETIFVGVPGYLEGGNNVGQVLVYQKPSTGWANATESYVLSNPGGKTERFGVNIEAKAISSSKVLTVSSVTALTTESILYVYEIESNNEWLTQLGTFAPKELSHTPLNPVDFLGYEVEITDNFILASARSGSTSGTLHLYERRSAGFISLNTSDIVFFRNGRSTKDDFYFGSELAFKEDLSQLVVLGSRVLTTGGIPFPSFPRLYIFNEPVGDWASTTPQNEVLAIDLPPETYASQWDINFSTDIQFFGDYLIVGINTLDEGGNVYIYEITETDGVLVDKISSSATHPASPTDNGDLFGVQVTVAQDKLLVGARNANTLYSFQLFYEVEETFNANCSNDTFTFGSTTITESGVYTKTFTSQEGLDSVVTVTATVPDPITLSTTKTDVSCNGEGDGMVVFSASGGTGQLEYSLDGVNYFTNQTFVNVQPGLYDAYVRDANGCAPTVQSVNITEPTEIIFSALNVVREPECSGEATGILRAIVSGGSGSYEYSFDNNAFLTLPTSGEITGLGEAVYDIWIRDTDGCEGNGGSSRSTAIREPDAPSPLVITLPTAAFVYGEVSDPITIAADPDDEVTTHYQISDFDNVEVLDATTDQPLASGDFVTIGTQLKIRPLAAGNVGLDVRASASDRIGCLGSSTEFVAGVAAKAVLTYEVLDATRPYGDVNPTFSIASITGFQFAEDEQVIDTPPSIATLADQSNNIGDYAITASGGVDNNYSFNYIDGTLSITEVPLTVTVNDKTTTFGDVLPTLDGTITGLKNNDDITATYQTSATTTSDAGTYPITVNLNDPDTKLGNYDQTITEATLTINKADQTITFPAIADIDIANTTAVNLSATSDAGLKVTYTLDEGDGSISGTTLTVNSTGNFTVRASQFGNTNYNSATDVSQSFAVTDSRKQDQTITFNAIPEQKYGDQVTLGATASSNLAVRYTLDEGAGTINDEILTIEGTGTYEVEASQQGDNTFNPAVSVTQTFNVTKATLTATADDQMINEGDVIPTLTLTYSGFKLSDDASSLDETPMISTTATAQSAAGTYPITLSGGGDDLYNITLVDGTLTIDRLLSTSEQTGISVYPNPATTQLRIEGSAYHEIRLISLDGKEIKKAEQAEALDLSELDHGQYIIQLFKDREVIHQQKVIKR